MRIFIRFFAVIVLTQPVHSAFAQPASTSWNCWFDGDAAVICLLQSVPASDDSPGALPPPTPPGPLPPIVHALRNAPGSIDGPIVIPLHTYPYDMDFVRELTQSVMCGKKPACAIAFSASLAEAQNRMVASR